MATPEFGSAFGVPYEFYASLSGLNPKQHYVQSQHQMVLFKNGGADESQEFSAQAAMFFALNSGLTPVSKYSTYAHANAYIAQYTLPQDWVKAILVDLGNKGNMGIVAQDTMAALNVADFGDIDALDYASVSVQISGTWAGTISFQVSNDGTTWVAKNLVNSTSTLASTATANGVWFGDIGARYFRVIMTTYTSGTATATAAYSTMSQANTIGTQAVTGTVNANVFGVAEQAETTTNLAASATYTGATRDLGTTVQGRSTLVRPVVMHNAGLAPGLLILQESTDATTWRETRRTPVPSDTSYRSFEWPVHMRYYRLLFTNGATAQTGFYLHAIRSQGEAGTMDAKNNLSFLLSTTALAASATFTSNTIDLGDNHIWSTARARVNLGTASTTTTIRLESSHDGTVWAASTAGTTTTTTAGLVVLERPITERYLRLVVVNGATAQASNQISLSLVSL